MKPHEYESFLRGIPVIHQYNQGSVDLWIDACSAIYSLSPMDNPEARSDHSVAAWHIEPLSIFESHYQGMSTRHSNWHVEESGAQIHVHRYGYGRASVETGGLPVESETGVITLLDYSRPFTALHTPSQCQSFFVPHSAINYRPTDAHHSPVYSPNSTVGRLLGAEMDQLLNSLKQGAEYIDPSDVQRFLGCVEVAMSPKGASVSARLKARESLKRSIMQFIEERLISPDLNVSLILQNFGVSRASLYRLFETDDGVRNYIGRRRLYRAVHELSGAPQLHGRIHEVSEKWGFSSDANFNRVVKREFGVPPGGLFQMPIPQASGTTIISRVHELMNEASKREREFA